MTSTTRRENEYDTLNRATMQEYSSEYQLLRADSMTAIRHRLMARDLGTQKLKEEECNSIKVALKKILITMVVVNIMLVLLITVIAVAMTVFAYTRPMTAEITKDIYSLKTEMNQLAVTFQTNLSTLQTNLSQVLFRLDALNSDILSVQQQSTRQQIQLYCGARDWQRIAFINMSDPSQQCPSNWREYNTSGVRACGREATTGGMCSSVLYSAPYQYSRVCGRLIGYQVASPDGFTNGQTADQMYMDGISITYGMPRQHIWSYVGGVTENRSLHRQSNCPCSIEAGSEPQSFVGNNYYCESGNPTEDFEDNQIFSRDPLWDGQQCEGTCCTGTNYPPWFSVLLPTPTNMIEVRICGDESTDNEDTLIEVLEILVS